LPDEQLDLIDRPEVAGAAVADAELPRARPGLPDEGVEPARRRGAGGGIVDAGGVVAAHH
jgi:hypothetical protein